MKSFLTFLLLATGPAVTAAQNQAPRKAADLITHSAVTIDRPASVIWPYIVDPNQWKQGIPLRHHAGKRGAVGEIFAAIDPADPGTIAFLVRNAELVPNQRRTIKLYQPGPDGLLLGFAIWTLVEHNGRTQVTYDVYSETLLRREQAAQVTARQLAAMERQEYESNKPRFDRELVALKALVEGR